MAGRSAEAAKEIKNLINASVERVEKGTVLVDKAGATMSEVVSSISRVNDIMGEISTASEEQALGVSQVGEAVNHMDQATQQNAALVEQMAAAASSLNSQAKDLVQVVAAFKLNAGESSAVPPQRTSIQKPLAGVTQLRKPVAPLQISPEVKPKAIPKPVALPNKPQQKAVVSNQPASNDDWETF